MISFLKIIRYKNLLLIAVMQLVFLYGFLKAYNIPLALYDWQYFILVFATVCIAAAGYLINNIFDQETDLINKPDDVVVNKAISETNAYNFYIILNVIGVGAGFYLSNVILKPSFAAIFIIIAGTLYLYASSLKQNFLIGNFIVALLTSLSVIIIGIFDLYPVIVPENKALLASVFKILIDYALFAFAINFIREIVKDLEDIKGDFNSGMKTLPIVFGVARTSKIALVMGLVIIVVLFFYIDKNCFRNQLYIATIYAYLLILAPLIYFCVKIWNAKTQKDFNHLSTILKIVLFFGILSIVVITLNMKYNA